MDCVELREWLQALLAPIIAMIAVYIAFQQHRTARDKLRLDLYDKRYEVYRATIEFLGRIDREAKVDLPEISLFISQAGDARFLFDEDVSSFVEELRQRAFKLRQLQRKCERMPDSEDRSAALDEEGALNEWFASQFEAARDTFLPYLRFGAQ